MAVKQKQAELDAALAVLERENAEYERKFNTAAQQGQGDKLVAPWELHARVVRLLTPETTTGPRGSGFRGVGAGSGAGQAGNDSGGGASSGEVDRGTAAGFGSPGVAGDVGSAGGGNSADR